MVFTTIAENLKSFFQKEEELEHSPKKIDDAAIEIFEKPQQKHTIVSNKLKTDSIEKPKPRTLPFSSKQLRRSLEQPTPPRQEPKPDPLPQHSEPPTDEIEAQIKEFEQHISGLPGEDGSSVPLSTSQESTPLSTPPTIEKEDTLFNNFASYLREQGYNFSDDEIPTDFIEKMKTHHEDRLAKKRHDKHADSLESEISKKLTQLQSLETDWVHKKEEVAAASERMDEIEDEISEKTEELRDLIAQMKSHIGSPPDTSNNIVSDRLQPSQYFRLADGRMVTSLQELQGLLKVMDDNLFYKHVTPERNDFALWVADVFNDTKLADKIAHVRTKYDLARLLESLENLVQ